MSFDVRPVLDESTPRPRWVTQSTPGGMLVHEPSAIVDPEFHHAQRFGLDIVNGFVTFQRFSGEVLVAGMQSPCLIHAQDRGAYCNENPYVSVYIHDISTRGACNVQAVDPKYWQDWKQSMIEIRPNSRLGVRGREGHTPAR